jgi:peptidoglycan hydrolase-like protein with peptidoglycan-binding domain
LPFQRRYNLRIDGLVNQQTTTALIQLGLNHIAKQSILAIDGIDGPKTRKMIIDFQSTQSAGPKDGIFGRISRATMTKLLLSELPAESTAKGIDELYQESEDLGKWYPLQGLPQI